MDNVKTISKTAKYRDEIFTVDSEERLYTGDYLLENEIIRITDGRLDGGELPAYESSESYHLEYLRKGILHRDKLPAIIGYDDEGFLVREWWENGKQIKVEKEIV